ncbi:MAG: hypothetical protein ABEI57_00770 [Halapricum sp.]
MSVERTPSRQGLALTGLTALLGAAAASLGGGVVALLGIPVAVAGVYRISRSVLAVGVAVLFAGVLLAGLAGGGPAVVLVAMAGTVLCWDVGENAISLAEQLRTGHGERVEFVHAATSTLVVSSVAVGGYVVFLFASGGQPGVAVSLLVLGTVLVLLVLSRN